MKLVGTFRIVREPSKTHSHWEGTAEVHRFEAHDPRCKVAAVAFITGVRWEALVSASGEVGDAVLRAAGLKGICKNAPVSAFYDDYSGVGCPADAMSERRARQVLVFYLRK